LVHHYGKIGTSHFAEQTAGAFFGTFYYGIAGIIGGKNLMRTKGNADATFFTPPPKYLNPVHLPARLL
jgi:hypothetical protein